MREIDILLCTVCGTSPDNMRVLFVCHGNICRSPMAEAILKDMASKRELDWYVESCATSNEEIGNDIYPPARRCLSEHGIRPERRRARRMTVDDYLLFDLIIAMDTQNLRNMRPFVGNDPEHKVSLMMSHCGEDKNVADPWYTGDFEGTFDDIERACEGLIREHID